MKRIILSYILLYSFTYFVMAIDIIPNREVEIVDDGIIVTYNFAGGSYQQDELYSNAKFWKIPCFDLIEESGKPSIPFRWDFFAVPNNIGVDIEILESEYRDTIFTLSPARHPLFDTDTIGYTLETVSPITPYLGFYPSSIISKGVIQNYRGQNIQKILVQPIQYNYDTRVVRSYSKIKYKIYFNETDNLEIDFSNKISVNDPLISNLVLNSAEENTIMSLSDDLTESEEAKDYLIISIPEYEQAIQEFAEWKKKLGFRVHVLLENNWTTESIKSRIKDLYNSDGVNLYYLLLVGDINEIPSYFKTYSSYSYVTDLYYGCMGNDNDYIPEIHRGRIPVKSNTEAQIVFDKIITYEQTPILDSTFYKQGLHCAYFQDINKDNYADRRFAQTSEEIYDYMQYIGKSPNRVYYAKTDVSPLYWNNGRYSFGEEIPQSIQKPIFPWDGDNNDIKQHINNGCFYVLQRDHGGETSWGEPNFTTNNIRSLENGEKTPIVFSFSCLTGKYNYSSDCFSEVFLKKENGGCVGIFAATETSFSGYNDVLAEVMFDAIWPDSILRIKMRNGSDTRTVNSEPVYELGQILDLGMNYLDEVDGNISTLTTSACLYTRELFHCFGDPSMMIRTETPKEFSPIIKRINGKISVNTNLDNVRISFYTPSLNKIDSYIGKEIEYTTEADSVIVSLTKHNYIPFLVDCNKNVYIQNETISGKKNYIGEYISIGEDVTTLKEKGEVIIQNADVEFQGEEVILSPGTYIDSSSNVIINP